MFEQILQLVKEQFSNNPQVAAAIPEGQEDAVHNEIASHVTEGLKSQAATQGGAVGLMSMLQNAFTSGSPVTSAIEGGLVGSLGSKFGLSPMVTGAIAAALPGILQKFVHKASDPTDSSVTVGGLEQSLGSVPGL